MSLKTRITEDMKSAMRARDKTRLSAIRLILAAIKQVEIDKPETVINSHDDTHVLSVLTKLAKQRRDSIQQYEAAGRNELAKKEKDELEIINNYLPTQLSSNELETLIQAAISSTQATSIKDMGKVIAALKPKLAGRADMGKVSAKIKAMLGVAAS